MTNATLRGKPYAGNPHVRFDEGEVASGEPRRGSLLYKTAFKFLLLASLIAFAHEGLAAEGCRVNVDATRLGKTLPNTSQVITYWNGVMKQDRSPVEWDASSPALKQYPINAFVRYAELMACTGGNASRDLFKNPDDRKVLDDYDFGPLVKACKGILSMGFRPYLKLGNTPRKFSSDYDGGEFFMNTRPPDDDLVHYRYMKACAKALKDAFGRDEVRTWRFAVLTEADNTGWFQARSKKKEDSSAAFFRLYDYAAKAFEEELGPDLVFGTHLLYPGDPNCPQSQFSVEDVVAHCTTGKNAATGKVGAPLRLLTASYYACPGRDNCEQGNAANILRITKALAAAGLTNVVTGVDEGRLIVSRPGSEKKDLLSRAVGASYEAAFDVLVAKCIIDANQDYFASWGYFSGPEVHREGIPSFHYFSLRELAKLSGFRRASVRVEGNVPAKEKLEALGGVSNDGRTVRIAVSRYRDLLEYTNRLNAALSVTLPKPFAGRRVRVSTLTLDDRNNWYCDWERDRERHGIKGKDFGWSPDDFAILSYKGLVTPKFRKIFEDELQPKYAKKAESVRPVVTELAVGADSMVSIPVDFVGNGAAFVEVFPLDECSCSEEELESRLPDIFAKSAAHYRALDAATAKINDNRKGDAVFPHGWNKWRTGKNEYDIRSIYWWTSGHFAGSFWYLYEATGDDFFKSRATDWTERLEPNSLVTNNHDFGFIMYCSYGNARRLLKTDKYDKLLVQTADSLCTRYNKRLGLLRSWGHNSDTRTFEVIPDNLMNLELLEFAAGANKAKGKGRHCDFDAIARSHADVTMKNHFRADGGCFHVLDYDQKTGKIQKIYPGQGLSTVTAWARGESWAIYGYTMMYCTTGYVRYLDFAKKLADFAINHQNMPMDGIPYWDYGAPGEERDTSAGAIMASALLELSQYVGAADRDRYRSFAVKQLLALASDAYFSKDDEVGHFLLKHGVGHKPAKSEIDTPLDYGDYYFLEALLRFRQLKSREKAVSARFAAAGCGADGIKVLPSKAVLPLDEHDVRSSVASSNVVKCALKAIEDPIPNTSDELYGEYWTTGNRSHYRREFFARLRNLDALTQVASGKVRSSDAPSVEKCIVRIEDYLAAICDMKSWVLPARDWPDGGRGVLRGTWISTDLSSTQVAAHLACVIQLVGDKLRPETVQRVKANAERRVFAPVRREVPIRLYPDTAVNGTRVMVHWWIDCGMNWNSVCWDNVVCAALGLIDDLDDRAYFLASADKAADPYIAHGFTSDGYCSEGMGYWNYGFGHHLMTVRLVDRVTGGKFNFHRRPKQRIAAAYARSYTLIPGVSPAFADGNGAAAEKFLALVDEFWPDLPKGMSPSSEFPDGQVWLLRDLGGLSVAFKGGHNDELHNHNDLGSYYLMDGNRFVAGDPGGEDYTRRTFSPHRYDSKVLNSYAHPVPIVAGKLQGTGRKYAAKVIEKAIGDKVGEVTLDLTAAYDVKSLKKLTRTFVYDRNAKTFTVRDHVEFTEPSSFEDCYVTFADKPNVKVMANGFSGGSAAKAVEKGEEVIDNPNKPTPHRFAWTFDKPVDKADVEFKFHSNN